MCARVTTTQINPEQWDESVRLTEDFVVPAAKQQNGFKVYLRLGDQTSGKTIVVYFWETEADRQASGQDSEYYREAIAKVAPLLTVDPSVEDLEVIIQV